MEVDLDGRRRVQSSSAGTRVPDGQIARLHCDRNLSGGCAVDARTSEPVRSWKVVGHGPQTVTNADRAPPKPVDAIVLRSEATDGKLWLTIALRDTAEHLGVEAGWAGTFTKDGKPTSGSEFKVLKVHVREAFATFDASQLPSQTVRLKNSMGARR